MTVVAAVVRRGDRYLLCRRPAHKRHVGLWEFPGGKVREGETLSAAIARELTEELGICTGSVSDPIACIGDEGSDFVICFLNVAVQGEPVAHEHDEIGWFTAAEMQSIELAPADRSLVDRLGAGCPTT